MSRMPFVRIQDRLQKARTFSSKLCIMFWVPLLWIFGMPLFAFPDPPPSWSRKDNSGSGPRLVYCDTCSEWRPWQTVLASTDVARQCSSPPLGWYCCSHCFARRARAGVLRAPGPSVAAAHFLKLTGKNRGSRVEAWQASSRCSDAWLPLDGRGSSARDDWHSSDVRVAACSNTRIANSIAAGGDVANHTATAGNR